MRVYLDYASITPIDPRVFRSMRPFLQENFANPSSLYIEGVEMKKALSRSRKKIASILKAHSDEIIFTPGGTEANNLALLGLFEAAKKSQIKKPHIITSAIEHPSILEVCREIERRGGKVSYIFPNENGLIDPKEIKKAINLNTILISIAYANNEIGTIQPIREIAKVIRQFKKSHSYVKREKRSQQLLERLRLGQAPRSGLSKSLLTSIFTFPYLHTDASQAANFLNLNVVELGIDLMTLDGTKIYGPRGAGALFRRRHIGLVPILFGGGQENGRRPGTENVAAAIGLAAALEISEKEKIGERKRLLKLRNYFIREVEAHLPKAILNGDIENRLPNNINFCFPGLDAEFAVLQFDAKGIAVSSVTSCQNLQEDFSSYVIEALDQKRKKKCSKSSIRFSCGRNTTKKEIDYCLKTLYNIVNGGTL